MYMKMETLPILYILPNPIYMHWYMFYNAIKIATGFVYNIPKIQDFGWLQFAGRWREFKIWVCEKEREGI